MNQKEAEAFVRLWQKHTGTYVAKKLKLSRQRVHQIAQRMRDAGIPLKKKRYPSEIASRLDIEKLKLIAELNTIEKVERKDK